MLQVVILRRAGAQVIKLISQVIADFASGEISQAEYQFDTELSLQQYLDKSFYKTATLIAASCKGAAAFSDVPLEVRTSAGGGGVVQLEGV